MSLNLHSCHQIKRCTEKKWKERRKHINNQTISISMNPSSAKCQTKASALQQELLLQWHQGPVGSPQLLATSPARHSQKKWSVYTAAGQLDEILQKWHLLRLERRFGGAEWQGLKEAIAVLGRSLAKTHTGLKTELFLKVCESSSQFKTWEFYHWSFLRLWSSLRPNLSPLWALFAENWDSDACERNFQCLSQRHDVGGCLVSCEFKVFTFDNSFGDTGILKRMTGLWTSSLALSCEGAWSWHNYIANYVVHAQCVSKSKVM